MDRKIIGVSIVIAIIIIVSSTIFSFQQIESSNEYRISEERFSNTEWNNELTRNLPTDYDLGADWELLWSDGSEDFIHGENPNEFVEKNSTSLWGKKDSNMHINYAYQKPENNLNNAD